MHDPRPRSRSASPPLAAPADRLGFVEQVLRVAPQTVFVRDLATGWHTYESRSILGLLGYAAEDGTMLDDGTLELLLHPDDAASMRQHRLAITQLDDGSPLEIEFRLRHQSGAWRWVHARESVLERDADGVPTRVVGVLLDITDRIELDRIVRHQTSELKRLTWHLAAQRDQLELANARLEALAERDSLTGLRNHGALQARLEAEFTHARSIGLPLAVVMVDVDHFKAFNDDHGHPAGDRALVRIADVLLGCARDTDFVARYGGEEFAVLLPATDRAGADIVAARIRERVAAAVMPERQVTASVGIALLAPSHRSPADLIADADRALYAAKRAGRDRVVGAWTLPPASAVA